MQSVSMWPSTASKQLAGQGALQMYMCCDSADPRIYGHGCVCYDLAGS